VWLEADVEHILTSEGRACGVEFEQQGECRQEQSRHVTSAMGIANTVACLDATTARPGQEAIRTLASGISYLSLFFGLGSDIAAAGAGTTNHWIYESEVAGAVWRSPADEDAPGIFVGFPSPKDPASAGQPTPEAVAVLDAEAFAPWLALGDDERPEAYRALKAWVEERLLAKFLRHFPALKPMVRFDELSTPVTQRRYVRSPDGAMYGIEMKADRLTSSALHARSPLPGLLLAGQDVTSPSVPGTFMGGLMAAAIVEPSLWRRMSG